MGLGILCRRSIGKVFQCRRSVPSIAELLKYPLIIEMDRLPADQACLLTLILASRIREYLKTQPYAGKGPRHVLCIEEAHNIVGQSGEAKLSDVAADPKAHTADFFVRMLAEMRALGEAIVVIDQLPSAVAAEVIKNTASKVAFVEVDEEERKRLGATMLFGPAELEDIARLQTGEAFIFTRGYYGPRRICTPRPPEGLGAMAVSDQELLAVIRDEDWFRASAVSRAHTGWQQARELMDQFVSQRREISRSYQSLLDALHRLMASPAANIAGLKSVAQKALELRRRLSQAHRTLLRGPLRTLLKDATSADAIDPCLAKMSAAAGREFQNVINTRTNDFLQRLDALAECCRDTCNEEVRYGKAK